ncbi:ABC transporter substrate-binding protein (plasmid) [Halorussus salilacus]|uniref:ABC transporter substrate-binding protein n=1 Tax=Halorussus salilacus TaxID=2953750 RepID=UPI0020A0D006|nr:ABC transporter substrate-binding protein [Halorussus salilacus]USZ69722.1 ABC transporter substrate-binding protein [Halorussus salilacus]
MSEKSNMSRRRFLEATGGAASAVALTGTAVGQDTTTESGQDTTTEGGQDTTQEGGGDGDSELNLINSTMTTLDPIEATDTASGTVIQQVFDALMNYPDGAIEVETQLADDYEVSDDFTQYTFQLKEGATYHNGEEVTAQDFVYAWERLAASENSSRAYFVLDSIGIAHETTTETTEEGEEEESYEPGTLAVEASDDYTLEMELEEPFHATLPMLAYTSFAAVPEGLVDDIEGYDGEMSQDEFASESPVGAGPFEFENWATNDEASVTRFDDYHGSVANVQRVHWNIVEDANARWTYVTNQNADVFQIPTQFYDPNLLSVENTDDQGRETGTYGPVERANDETLNYQGVPTINAFYIGFNTDTVEKPARQAAAYAMNQQDVLDQIFKGRGEPSYHFTPPTIYPGGPEEYQSHAEENYPYGYNETQLDQARQVMEEAGYGQNERYSFTMTVYESSDTWEDVAVLLRDQLASAHIDMAVESAPFSTLLERGRNGNLGAYSLGWVMDWPAPDNFLQLLNPPQTDTSQAAPISYFNWSDTDAASSAEEAWATIEENRAPTDEDEQARGEAYVQMEEANWEDIALLPTYHELDQRFSYESVDISAFGAAGTSRQMYNEVSLN